MSLAESYWVYQHLWLRLKTFGLLFFFQIIITQIDAFSIQLDPAINPITVNGGQISSLKCYMTYSTQTPTITWAIGNREISSHKEVTTSIGSIMTELRYEFQSYDHGQTITCLARQTDGSWVSSYSQLNVVQPAQNVQQPTPPPPPISNTPGASVITNIDIEPTGNPITVNAGQKTDIKCLVSYIGKSQSPVITWKIGNREIDIPKTVTSNPAPINPGQYGLGSTTNILRYHFQSSDNGQTITCTARLADGTWKNSYSQLRVVGPATSNNTVTPRPTQPKNNLPPELKGINWSQYIDESALLKWPSGQTVPGFTAGRSYYLGFGQANLVYQTCTTPKGAQGKCRFLQHCARPQIIVSLSTFLTYACPIGNDFMGVCCPESEVTTVPKNPPPPPSTTTNRPTTRSTTRPTTARTTKAQPQPKTIAPKITTTPQPPATKKGCGELIKEQTRIVGGYPADPGEWPWMAALLHGKKDQYCGGVLITDQHVLTASHCVYRGKPEEVTVRLGEYEFSKASNSRRDFAVDAIFMHEQYDRRTHQNDIALVRLKEKATFNSMIWPICLPPSSMDYSVLEGQSAYVAGWGTTSYSGHSSDILMEIFLPIWKIDDCKKSYVNRPPITDKQLCAGYKEGGRDSCQGDSGGPLMYQSASGRWTVIGIVSWGHRCAEKNQPGVYVRVTSYSDWIRAKVLA